MKKTLIAALLLVAGGSSWAGGFGLEGEPLALLKAVEVPGIPEPSRASAMDQWKWGETAANALRAELLQYKIRTEVSLGETADGRSCRRALKPSGSAFRPCLIAGFHSAADYESIKDLFYQDPGAPSYMGVKVFPKILTDAEKLGLLGDAVTELQVQYRAAGSSAERQAIKADLEKAIKEYSDFQAALLRARGLSGASGEELRELEDQRQYYIDAGLPVPAGLEARFKELLAAGGGRAGLPNWGVLPFGGYVDYETGFGPRFDHGPKVIVSEGGPVNEAQKAQLFAGFRQLGEPAATLGEAFEMTDDGEFMFREAVFRQSGDKYTLCLYYAGDTMAGWIFEGNTAKVVAVISDGSIYAPGTKGGRGAGVKYSDALPAGCRDLVAGFFGLGAGGGFSMAGRNAAGNCSVNASYTKPNQYGKGDGFIFGMWAPEYLSGTLDYYSTITACSVSGGVLTLEARSYLLHEIPVEADHNQMTLKAVKDSRGVVSVELVSRKKRSSFGIGTWYEYRGACARN